MAVIKIEVAQREGARLVIGLSGVSGSGKTFSALRLAWGMAKHDSSKVGLLCTENRRGRLYSDALKDAAGKVHRFMVADLVAPFSPARYVEAIEAFAAAGIEVLVIDSVSHEWEGIGGCEDIAHAGSPKVPRWNEAKREHKSFMNAMLASPVHVIACLRAREKVKMEKRNGVMEYQPMGVLPIQEKNFTFELTASMMLANGGKSREVLKCPDELADLFGTTGTWVDGYLTDDTGRRLREWVDGGQKLDPAVQAAHDSLHMVAERGVDALAKAWGDLSKAIRKAIGADRLAVLQASAAEFDRQRNAARDGGQDVADLNAQVMGGAAAPQEGGA